MREITKLTISILYLIFLLSVMCVQGSNVTGTLFQLTSKVTTCADIYARLLTKPLSNPLLGSLSYSVSITLYTGLLIVVTSFFDCLLRFLLRYPKQGQDLQERRLDRRHGIRITD